MFKIFLSALLWLSYEFWYVVLLLYFSSEYFLISLMIPTLTAGDFTEYLFF